MEMGGQRHVPAALPPLKTRHPLYRKLGGLGGRSGRMRKISPPTRIRPPHRTARRKSLFRLGYPGPPCSLNLSCIKIEHICPIGNGLNFSALFLHRPCIMHPAAQSGGVIRRTQTEQEACHMLISLK